MTSKFNTIILTIMLMFGGTYIDINTSPNFEIKVVNDIKNINLDEKNIKLDKMILEKENEQSIEVIIHHSEKFNYLTFELKDRIEYIFKDISAFKINLEYDEIMRLSLLDYIENIELVKKIEPLLLDSTEQMGIPSAFWSNGEFGSSNLSIAIVDSGIDASHSAFKDNLIASYNAIDDNLTAPFDTVGHGTHVAGIASSSTNMSGIFKESFRDFS